MPDSPQLPNGWNAWGNHVLKALETNESQHKDFNDTLTALVTKIAVIETKMTLKAGAIGLLGGVIPVAITLAIWLVTRQ